MSAFKDWNQSRLPYCRVLWPTRQPLLACLLGPPTEVLMHPSTQGCYRSRPHLVTGCHDCSALKRLYGAFPCCYWPQGKQCRAVLLCPAACVVEIEGQFDYTGKLYSVAWMERDVYDVKIHRRQFSLPPMQAFDVRPYLCRLWALAGVGIDSVCWSADETPKSCSQATGSPSSCPAPTATRPAS